MHFACRARVRDPARLDQSPRHGLTRKHREDRLGPSVECRDHGWRCHVASSKGVRCPAWRIEPPTITWSRQCSSQRGDQCYLVGQFRRRRRAVRTW